MAGRSPYARLAAACLGAAGSQALLLERAEPAPFFPVEDPSGRVMPLPLCGPPLCSGPLGLGVEAPLAPAFRLTRADLNDLQKHVSAGYAGGKVLDVVEAERTLSRRLGELPRVLQQMSTPGSETQVELHRGFFSLRPLGPPEKPFAWLASVPGEGVYIAPFLLTDRTFLPLGQSVVALGQASGGKKITPSPYGLWKSELPHEEIGQLGFSLQTPLPFFRRGIFYLHPFHLPPGENPVWSVAVVAEALAQLGKEKKEA